MSKIWLAITLVLGFLAGSGVHLYGPAFGAAVEGRPFGPDPQEEADVVIRGKNIILRNSLADQLVFAELKQRPVSSDYRDCPLAALNFNTYAGTVVFSWPYRSETTNIRANIAPGHEFRIVMGKADCKIEVVGRLLTE